MWLREQIGPQAYTVNSSILWLGLNKDEHPSPCVSEGNGRDGHVEPGTSEHI